MTDLLDRTKLQKREWYERNKERLAEEAKYANTQPAHPRCNRRKGNRI